MELADENRVRWKWMCARIRDQSGTQACSSIQLEVFVRIDYHEDTLRINSLDPIIPQTLTSRVYFLESHG